MFTLEITQSAETDLDKITDYLGFELSNPKAALALLDEIDRVSATLTDSPELFPLCSDSRLAEQGYERLLLRRVRPWLVRARRPRLDRGARLDGRRDALARLVLPRGRTDDPRRPPPVHAPPDAR